MSESSIAAAAQCPDEDELALFVSGDSDESARAAIELHIDGCARCAQTIALFGGAYASAHRGGDEDDEVGDARADEPKEAALFAGRYRIRECVGAGSGGTVYAAIDRELDRVVALKVLRGHAVEGASTSHRIAREARVMAKVAHPNVVAVHDVGQADEHVFIATEFVKGTTLDGWRHAQKRSWREVVEVYVAAGRGLAAIHDCGLVHRDFKPHNVLIGDDGRVRVTDFGLARLQPDPAMTTGEVSLGDVADPELSPGMLAETLASHTRTGAVVGTPAYMSPEQWRGRPADARSDQFGFCVALFEALFDTRPFSGRTSAELAAAVIEGKLREPSGHRVPRWVVRPLLRGLASDPADRFASMHALLGELVEAPRRRRRRAVAAALAAGFVAVGSGAYAVARATGSTCTEPARVAALWSEAAQSTARDQLGIEYDATASAVDAWLASWRTTHAGACATIEAEPTAARATLECLDRALSEMSASVDVMLESRSDATALAGVIQESALPVRCADADHWMSIQPEYTTPMGRALAAELAGEIDRVDALRYAGRHDEAMAIAIAILVRAELDGDHAVRADALLAIGQLHAAHKQTELAMGALRDALWAAQASGHVVASVDAWTEMAAVLGGQLERYDAALDAASLARAGLVRVKDPHRELTLSSDEAMVHSVAGKYERALPAQQQVLAQALELYGPTHRQVARVRINVATVLYHLGRLPEAIDQAEEALSVQRELYSGPNTATADMMSTLGGMYAQQGQTDKARATLTEGLAILEQTGNVSQPMRVGLLSNLAAVNMAAGPPAEAVRSYEEVLAIQRELYDKPHADVALALHNLAGACDKAGDIPRAIALYRESLAMRLVTSGPDHPSTATTQHSLGTLLLAHGSLEKSIALLERALVVREAASVDPWRRATTNFMLAKAREKENRRDEALAHADRAIALLREIAPRQAELIPKIEAWVAALPPRRGAATSPEPR
jgi:tetratricopeptide (TPR) repeat protein/predicted Ser/Thr protein kinase